MSDSVDFFISYTTQDQPWAEWIAWMLEAEGHSTRIQLWDFRPGSNFVRQMEHEVANAKRTIAVLSPGYLQSRFTKPEWHAAFADDPTGKKGILVPIRVEKCELKGLLPQIVSIDLVDLDRDQAADALLRGIERDRNKVKPDAEPSWPGNSRTIDPAEPQFPGASLLSMVWHVEHRRNPNFTGREDELKQLRKSLEEGGSFAVTQAVHGLGGIGKTQLAVEYAYRFGSSYQIVWWIRAEDPVTIVADLNALARKLPDFHVPETADEITVADRVREWLERHGDWLLIFDNAVDPDSIRSFLPRSGAGHILVTSRSGNWGEFANTIKLEVWSVETSTQYLLKRTGENDESASRRLAKELGCLPLAIAQAAGYLTSVPGMQLQSYLELFKTDRARLWKDEAAPSQYEQTVATTWNLALKQLSPVSVEFLRLLSFFGPDAIPLQLFKAGGSEYPKKLRKLASDTLVLNRTLRELSDHGFVEAFPESVSIHRLVQSVVRDGLATKTKNRLAGAAVSVLNEAFPFQEDQPQTWEFSGKLLPHVGPSVRFAQNTAAEVCGRLLNEAGLYLLNGGIFNSARTLLSQAIEINEKAYESDHPTLATGYSNLATVEQDLGNLDVARTLLKQAIEIDEKAYESDHPTLAIRYSNLALVEQDLGNLDVARTLLKQAIEIDEKAYESDHPTLAIRYSNLALVEQDLGNLDVARTLLKQAIEIQVKAHDSDHPALATSYSNLALVERDLRNLDVARTLLKQAIEIEEKAYESDHPTLAISYYNLALVEKNLGNLDVARTLLKQAIEIEEKAYESDHPTLAISYSNLALVEQDLGNLDAARILVGQAHEIASARLGLDHPDTIWIASLRDSMREVDES